MANRFLRTLALAVIAAAIGPAAHAGTAPALGLHLKPCAEGLHRAKSAALCGTFGVYEDRAARSGRIIELNVVVVKALHPTHHAIAWIEGGPGASAVMDAPFVADGLFEKEIRALHGAYDMLFVDSRGMGRSNATHCDVAPSSDPASYFAQLWPDKLLAACHTAYLTHANPNFYNTNNAVDDLDDVRAALGYPKLALDGGSYGTFEALVSLRRHPDTVESALLDGVDPPHFDALPGAPDGAQNAIGDLMVKCRKDASCNAHFPHFAQYFQALIARFDRGPLAVRLKNKHLKQPRTIDLSKEVFVDHLRQAMYDPQSAAYIPYIVEQVHEGNTAPLATMIDTVARGFAGELDMATNLSYMCADAMPFLDPAKVKAAAALSFAGDLRIRAELHACTIWSVNAMPRSFDDPVRSSAPALLMNGTDDPATPIASARAELPYLSNAKLLVVRGAGHGVESPCTDRVAVAFLRARSVQRLDVNRCTATFTVPKFATSMKGWPEF
ncbi:MAG: alpha/beta fold hydrolase [Candidatus Baltobacteraceae bacterium]